jgi:hypothetical protein
LVPRFLKRLPLRPYPRSTTAPPAAAEVAEVAEVVALRAQVAALQAELGGRAAAGGGHGNLDHLKAEGDINLSPRRQASSGL